MKQSHLTLLSLLIICATAVLYVSSSRDDSRSTQRPLHGYVNPSDVQSVSIEQAGKRAELVPRETEWYLRDRDLLIAADAGAMIKVFDFINTAMIMRVVTKKPEIWPRFELDDTNALKLTLDTGGRRSTVYIGKKKDHASQFVRLPGDPAVYLVSKTLETGAEPWRWQFRRVLRYEPEMLERIDYGCGQTAVRLRRDAASGTLSAQDIPEGKASADLAQLPEAFRDISVAEYIPRHKAPKTEILVTHTLYFSDGSSARLRFFDRDEDKDIPPALDIAFDEPEPADDALRYAKDVCARYVFALSWIDASQYLKKCDEFFIDQPPNSRGKDAPQSAAGE